MYSSMEMLTFLFHFLDYRIDSAPSQPTASPRIQLPSFSSVFARQNSTNRFETSSSSALLTASNGFTVPNQPPALAKRIAPALIPISKPSQKESNEKPILFLPPIIRLVSSKKNNATDKIPDDCTKSLEMGFEHFLKQMKRDSESDVANREVMRSQWDALSSTEKDEFVVAAQRQEPNGDTQNNSTSCSPPASTYFSQKTMNCNLVDQNDVDSAKNDIVPNLQEYPADYETILINFE